MTTYFAPLVHGGILALGLILPIGPQNLFILQQGAAHVRWTQALPAVLAASLADTAMIAASVSGGTAILSNPILQLVMLLAGTFLLARTGFQQWRSRGIQTATAKTAPTSTRRQITTALAVSILNPYALIDFATVIGPSSLSYAGVERWSFALGCMLNSWLWFPALALAGHCACRFFTTSRSQQISGRISALILWACAAFLSLSLTKALRVMI